jgi:hypothetical protein
MLARVTLGRWVITLSRYATLLSRRLFRRKNQNHYGAENSGDFYHPFQVADAPHAPALCARRERPRSRRAAKQRDELAAFCMSGKEHCEG